MREDAAADAFYWREVAGDFQKVAAKREAERDRARAVAVALEQENEVLRAIATGGDLLESVADILAAHHATTMTTLDAALASIQKDTP